MGKYDKYRQPQTAQQSKYSDIINKYKKKEADKDMGIFGTAKQQLGEVASQVYEGVKNIPKEEGLIRKTWGDFEKRADNINQNNATLPMGDRKTLRNIGEYGYAFQDFVGNAFSSGIKTFVPKSVRESTKDVASLALETKPGQMTKELAKNAYTQWKAFEKSNPELAKDLVAVGGIVGAGLNFVGAGQASKLKPTGLSDDILSNINRTVKKNASNISTATQRMASKIPGQVDNLATGTGEVGISAATGLSREAQQIIKKQPGLYQQARQGTITREAVTDDVVGALSKRMDDISDLGKGYEAIRTSTITVPKNDIANIAVSHLDDMKVSKIDLPIGDRGTVQKALDYIRELPDTMTAQNALSLRRKFDDLINWKSEATGEGKRIIKGLRKKVDDYLGEKLPGLKDLDRKYGPEREFIDKVKGTILDKQGNLKDGAISSVANMIGKGKEMKLDRFEKLLPGIGDKVRALKAFEEIQNLAQIKTGSVARQIFSFAVGGIPGFVATNPYVVGYALEKYGFAKEAIKRILSKGKKISEAEAKAVHRAVKSVSKKEVEKIIAGKVGTPLLPAGKSSVATGNTAGNIPPADLTPNASTGNAVSSQARISPPQSVGLLDSPKSTISETAQQVSTPVVKSPGEKVTPIIPKPQPKAKLRTNEDALKKPESKLPKTPQEGKTAMEKPEFLDWSVNGKRIAPNKIGTKFTKEQTDAIESYLKSKNIMYTWENVRDEFGNVKSKYISVPRGTKGGSEIKREIAYEEQQADYKKNVTDKENALKESLSNNTDVLGAIEQDFGKDFANDYNKKALIDFIKGDSNKFQGMINNKWEKGLEKIGAIKREGDGFSVDWKKVKETYQSKPSALSQKSEVKYSKPDTLVQEAKKYKSADDFMKAQGEPVYHGTDRVFDKFDLSKLPENEQGLYGRGIYVSPNKDFTAKYGKNNIEIIIDKKANLVDWDTKLPATSIIQLKSVLKDKFSVDSDTLNHIFSIPSKPINLYKRMQDILEISPKKASDIFSESGIHGITVSKNGKLHEISIFDDSKIKTKQQLLDIYNKANKK